MKPLKAKSKAGLSDEDQEERRARLEAERESMSFPSPRFRLVTPSLRKLTLSADKKQAELMKANIMGKKGPLNTGGQGIKKSGKK